MIEAIQNQDIPLYIDFGDDAPLDSIVYKFFRVNDEKTTLAEFRYPLESGFYDVTIDDTKYSFVVPKEVTANLLGKFAIEVKFVKDGVTLKAQTDLGSIILKAK